MFPGHKKEVFGCDESITGSLSCSSGLVSSYTRQAGLHDSSSKGSWSIHRREVRWRPHWCLLVIDRCHGFFPTSVCSGYWKALSSKHKVSLFIQGEIQVPSDGLYKRSTSGTGCLDITPGKTLSKLSLFFIPSKHLSSNNRATTNLLRNRSFQIWSFLYKQIFETCIYVHKQT